MASPMAGISGTSTLRRSVPRGVGGGPRSLSGSSGGRGGGGYPEMAPVGGGSGVGKTVQTGGRSLPCRVPQVRSAEKHPCSRWCASSPTHRSQEDLPPVTGHQDYSITTVYHGDDLPHFVPSAWSPSGRPGAGCS